jgi:hypothetical protein
MTNATIWNQVTGESKTCPQAQADHLARNSMGEWSFKQPLPPGWDREKPKYRVEVNLHPSSFARHRHEPPFTSTTDSTMFQYADRDLRAGEVLELLTWPHPSMTPLNETARRALAYFTSHQKSRLPMSPWVAGRLRLEDGLSGAPPVQGALRPNLPSPGRWKYPGVSSTALAVWPMVTRPKSSARGRQKSSGL